MYLSEERGNLQFELLQNLHLNSNCETWHCVFYDRLLDYTSPDWSKQRSCTWIWEIPQEHFASLTIILLVIPWHVRLVARERASPRTLPFSHEPIIIARWHWDHALGAVEKGGGGEPVPHSHSFLFSRTWNRNDRFTHPQTSPFQCMRPRWTTTHPPTLSDTTQSAKRRKSKVEREREGENYHIGAYLSSIQSQKK